MTDTHADKRPTPDVADFNAYFPSPYSLSQFTASRTGAAPVTYPDAYRGGKWKVLVLATDRRYMTMRNGARFSTGNHPVETLLPMYHLDRAGFEMDVVTLSGDGVKLEMWAMPKEDELVQGIFNKYAHKLASPRKLSDVLAQDLHDDSPYVALFIPGGHGAMLGLPQSEEVKQLLLWFMRQDRHVLAICHGPAVLLAAGLGETRERFVFNGYKMAAFPDAIDRQTPAIGYIPGEMPWYFGEQLQDLGVAFVNQDISGRCHQDRKLITGDSPLAANAFGQQAAEALLREVRTRA
jgi:molecular chaperone Hsp31 and glyoxalase 3